MAHSETSGGSTTTTHMSTEFDEGHRANTHSLRAEVDSDGTLVLRPNDALGALYLHRFGHGRLSASWEYRGMPQRDDPYSPLRCLRVKTHTRPILSTGGDPHHTGMSLSDAERDACRALVDKMRGRHERQCPATTKSGERCRNPVGEGGDGRCYVHRSKA